MGKTRADIGRTQKRQEIVSVARRLFLEVGYDATSTARLADEAGVAVNTLYWYFADKDALLVAVLDELLGQALREAQQKLHLPLDSQIVWLLGQLEGADRLVVTVHARAAASETVRTWHDNFHRMLEALLVAKLRDEGVPAAHLQHASRAAMFVVEGLFAHPTATRDRRALLRWLLSVARHA